MNADQTINTPLEWKELVPLSSKGSDRLNGPTSAHSLLRLFGQPEQTVRVTLYRDHHAWCPYCQKIWLWLEWKRIPYRTRKVTMRCYGQKESLYLKKVPSGMLPALELDNRLITESDQILLALEDSFGPLGAPLESSKALKLRNLERKLFRAWCLWLCNPALVNWQQEQRKESFQAIAQSMEESLKAESPFLDTILDDSGNSSPGSSDIIFIPYLERMNASLAYYKGFNLRKEHPAINNWFKALETFEVYRGTQGDFHTHAHDLPPQMGGCFFNTNSTQQQFLFAIDSGEGLGDMETYFSHQQQCQQQSPESIALSRVLKHRQNLLKVNPLGAECFDQPLRAALTLMIKGKSCNPNKGSALGLRYLRDRISVPRDMPLLAARKIRKALEQTAQIDSPEQGPPIGTRDRFDQDPKPFLQQNL